MRLVVRGLSLLLSLISNSRALNNSTACGIPGKPFGGDVFLLSQNTFNNGENVHYSCRWIDFLLGNVNRMCGMDGKWTGSVPACLSPAPAQELLEELPRETKHNRQIISDKRFFDNNIESCRETSNASLRISITFIRGSRVLEGVRVVFAMPMNHNFTVQSENFQSVPTHCIQSGSGSFSTGYQITFSCSLYIGAIQRVYLSFDESLDPFSICEIFLFYRPDDTKCDTPDAPLHGQIQQVSNVSAKSFTFYCDPGFDLTGSTYTTCASNGSWTQETPKCIKKIEENHSFQEIHKSHRMIFVNGVVAGVLGILVIGGIVIVLYCAVRRRKVKRRYRNRPNHSSQRSNSFEVSVHRERISSVRYSESPGFRNEEYREQEDRPRSDIPDILGHKVVRSLATVRAMDFTPSRAGSASGHIYTIPVYDDLDEHAPRNRERIRKSDFVMTDNEYYSSNS